MTGIGRLRVLHLTDPHLFAGGDGELRGVVTARSLERTLASYRDSGWQADLAIVTGDIVQDDTAAAYERFRDQLASLRVPVHCVPGNHDVPALMREALADPPFHYCDAVGTGDWLLVGLDTTVPGNIGGRLGDFELERLARQIDASDAANVLVHLHHPPVAVGSRWLDSVGLDNADRVLDRLAVTPRVRALLFGHVHQAYDRRHGALRIVGTPSTCRQFRPGSDEFAVDDRPPAWRQLELYANGELETRLVWVDGD